MKIRTKVCGVTRPEDAIQATALGVDAIGLNFVSTSTRLITPSRARSIVAVTGMGVDIVGVFVNAAPEFIRETAEAVGLATVQLHGQEPPEVIEQLKPLRVVRALPWSGPEAAAAIDAYLGRCQALGTLPVSLLLDAHSLQEPGGTGVTWNWTEAVADMRRWSEILPVWIAGGLTPRNVGEAIRLLRPAGVDTASGVETAPGIKSADKIRAFAEEVGDAADELGFE